MHILKNSNLPQLTTLFIAHWENFCPQLLKPCIYWILENILTLTPCIWHLRIIIQPSSSIFWLTLSFLIFLFCSWFWLPLTLFLWPLVACYEFVVNNCLLLHTDFRFTCCDPKTTGPIARWWQAYAMGHDTVHHFLFNSLKSLLDIAKTFLELCYLIVLILNHFSSFL